MNIALVTQALPYLPCHDGFRLIGANLLRCLSRRHQVDLFSLLREDDYDHVAWARKHCATFDVLPVQESKTLLTPLSLFSTYAWGKPLRYRRRLSAFLGKPSRRWDVLHVEGSYAGGLIPGNFGLPSVLSLHDSWKLRCQQMAACSTSWRRRLRYRLLNQIEGRYERLVYPRFDRCVVVSDADARAIRTEAPRSRVAVVSNGIDTDYFRPTAPVNGHSTLVFHGNMEYAPNVQAAVEFSRDIFPIIRQQTSQAVFHMVGAKPVQQIRDLASLPGIKLSANLPDLRPALCNSRVYVCPLRYGSGVKNKLLEAMALGLPIIAYPEAVRGIDCIPGKHLLVAEDRAEFARRALDLLNCPQQGEEIGRAARRHVMENYSWESRAEEFERIYAWAIERRKARLPPAQPVAPCPHPLQQGHAMTSPYGSRP
jgi:polysaccharide biosynthesis protein PslH